MLCLEYVLFVLCSKPYLKPNDLMFELSTPGSCLAEPKMRKEEGYQM